MYRLSSVLIGESKGHVTPHFFSITCNFGEKNNRLAPPPSLMSYWFWSDCKIYDNSFRYKDFRDREGNPNEFYWHLICIRLLFVIIFEVNIVFISRRSSSEAFIYIWVFD